MRVIGLFGLIGSGKDTVADHLAQKYGYNVIIMGDIIREFCTQRGLEPTRDNMLLVQREQVQKYTIKWFAEEVIRRIRIAGWQKVVIGGMRRPEDAEVPKHAFGKDFILIQVDADPKIRFERMRARARVGDPKTLEEFLHQEELDKKAFDFAKLKTYIDYTVTNNGTLEELHVQVDKLLKKTGFA